METQMEQPKKLRKLTKKERGFVKDYVLTENGTQSALKNYDTKDYKTASVIASENLDKPRIQVAIEETRKTLKNALIEEGVNEQYIAKKVNVLLTAEKKVFRNNVSTGEIEEIGTEPDYNAIDKGLKHATNIYGVEDIETKPKGNNTYNFIFNAEAQSEIKAMEEKIKAKLINPNA